MKTTRLLVVLLVLTITIMNVPVAAEKPALVVDTIIINAIVHTMDPSQPTAEAVAILANRIVAVGNTKEIRKLAGPNTRTIDAKKRLLPQAARENWICLFYHDPDEPLCRLQQGEKEITSVPYRSDV